MGETSRFGHKIIELGKENYGLWDELVKKSPQGSVFNLRAWGESMAELAGTDYKIIACQKNDALLGGCALYSVKALEGRIAKLPALTHYNGVIISANYSSFNLSGETRYNLVLNSIIDYLENNFDSLTLVNHPGLVDIRPFLWKRWSCAVRYTYVIPLKNIEQTYANMDSAVKNKVRKATKSGFTINKESNFGIFYELWRISFNRQGIRVPYAKTSAVSFFESLNKHNLLRMYSATDTSGKVVAARIELLDNHKAFDLAAGVDSRYLNSGANQLLMWTIFEDLAKNGYEYLDFVGADIPSIAAYKSTFGGRLVPYFQVSRAVSFQAKFIKGLKVFYRSIKKD